MIKILTVFLFVLNGILTVPAQELLSKTADSVDYVNTLMGKDSNYKLSNK